ncbi:MAG: T9SS type A sorting domain-containing protein, partial [Bacteroidetes bacterium]|nr:T9SS type A sorting domain-containing protein [Bacteroidota bacterium]
FMAGAAQCPSEEIMLTTQAEIDAFAANYPNCTNLQNQLTIDGLNSTISNLEALSVLENGQTIYIGYTEITSLSGLHNIETLGELSLWFNPNIEDLSGLDAMQSIGRLECYVNNSLTSLNGVENVLTIGDLNLFENDNLADISQIDFIDALASLTLGGNALSTFTGLENLQSVAGDVSLSNELTLNFNELSNLQTIGGSLFITNNQFLEDITAFSNVQSLTSLFVTDNPSLNDLSGINNVQEVSDHLRIGFNGNFSDLSVLSNLVSVVDLDIYENPNLQSLDGLENLQEISGTLQILNNPILTNLEGLNNVSTSEVNTVAIANNPTLSACSVDFVCGVIENVLVAKTILNNSAGCNGLQEIQDQCLLGTMDSSLEQAVVLHPNPASNFLQVSTSSGIQIESVNIISLLGSQVMKTNNQTINVSALASGVYFVQVATSAGILTKKIVKE